jgi:hypothetical protein
VALFWANSMVTRTAADTQIAPRLKILWVVIIRVSRSDLRAEFTRPSEQFKFSLARVRRAFRAQEKVT